VCAHLKNPPNHFGFSLVHAQEYALAGALVVIPEAPPPGMKASQRLPFQSAMSFLGQLANVHRINQTVHAHQQLSLLIVGVYALGHRNNANTNERQPLSDSERVCYVPREPTGVIDEHNIERLWLCFGKLKESHEPRSVRTGSR
jgi:hypothetical protein